MNGGKILVAESDISLVFSSEVSVEVGAVIISEVVRGV